VQIRSRRHQSEWLVPAVYPEELVENGEVRWFALILREVAKTPPSG
jgi:hypothetical protein